MADDSNIFFNCPSCGRRIGCSRSFAGQTGSCPRCKESVVVPESTRPKSSMSEGQQQEAVVAHKEPEPHRFTWRDLIAQYKPLVPMIESRDGLGSGVLMSTNGLIVTNRHVVEKGTSLSVSFDDGVRSHGMVLDLSREHDLAVIRAAVQRDRGYSIATMCASGCCAGDEAVAIGHPRGLQFTATRGMISDPARIVDGQEFVQTDISINPGNSGGPLFSADGKLIGINTFIINNSHGLSFAIPAKIVAVYYNDVVRRISSGLIPLPSDQDIARKFQEMDPEAIVRAAAATMSDRLRLVDEVRQSDSLALLYLTPGGNRLLVAVTDSVLLCRHSVAKVSVGRSRMADLYKSILQANNNMLSWSFRINEDDEMSLGAVRDIEGIGVEEACAILSEGVSVVDTYGPLVTDYLGTC